MDIAMDFNMRLSAPSRYKSGRKQDAILVVVDYFTKLACYYAVTSEMTTPQLADLIARKLVLRGVGFPNSIVTN